MPVSHTVPARALLVGLLLLVCAPAARAFLTTLTGARRVRSARVYVHTGPDVPHTNADIHAQSPPRAPSADAYKRTDMDMVRADIRELRSVITHLCGALIYSDDLAMLERQTAEIGRIYQDTSFQAHRRPLFTRVAIQNVLRTHGLEATPLSRSWVHNATRFAAARTTNTTKTNTTNTTNTNTNTTNTTA